MVPVKYCTEAEVKNMIAESRDHYETTVGAVRHSENAKKIEKLITAFNRAQGAIWTVGAIMAGLELYFKLSGK